MTDSLVFLVYTVPDLVPSEAMGKIGSSAIIRSSSQVDRRDPRQSGVDLSQNVQCQQFLGTQKPHLVKHSKYMIGGQILILEHKAMQLTGLFDTVNNVFALYCVGSRSGTV